MKKLITITAKRAMVAWVALSAISLLFPPQPSVEELIIPVSDGGLQTDQTKGIVIYNYGLVLRGPGFEKGMITRTAEIKIPRDANTVSPDMIIQNRWIGNLSVPKLHIEIWILGYVAILALFLFTHWIFPTQTEHEQVAAGNVR